MHADDLDEWTPFAIHWEEPEPLIEWCHLGERRFVEPWFDQTIHSRRCDPDYRHGTRVTPARALNAIPQHPPAGFIFHTSRCGSTLVARMLASLPQTRILSEPAILDSVLFDGSAQLRLLRGIVAALGKSTTYFIKFSSRAILAMPLIRRAFPYVPWAFLYREPLEILGAQLQVPAASLPPGIAQAGLMDGDPAELERMPPPEFWTRVLATRCAAALDSYDPASALLVNYRELPNVVWERLLPFFGITCLPEEIRQMSAVATQNAKNPSRHFEADGDRKRRASPPEVHALIDSLVMPHYRQLESIRLHRI